MQTPQNKHISEITHIFREYDIRGIFGDDLTQEVVFGIGQLLGKYIRESKLPPCIHIGYDARTHSPTLLLWLAQGFASADIEVYELGLVPTPVAYFATFNAIDSITCPHSIMITGSHNPPQYNGFKITINQAPFYGEQIRALGAKLSTLLNQRNHNISPHIYQTQAYKKINALGAYTNYLTESFTSLKNFPYPIAVDCGNGVGGVGIRKILENLNINYTPLFFEPDGTFPNHHPDPSEEKNLIALKEKMKSDSIPIGIAFDGDADRLALLTTHYNYKGDELAILFAQEMKRRFLSPIVIGEVKCSQVMYDEINKIGKAVMYKTGHSNLKVKLKELNAHLAAEMSGHLFFNDRYFGYDDAIYASLRVLELFLHFTPEELESTINALPHLYSTEEEKIPTTEEEKFTLIHALGEALKNPPADFPYIKDIINIDGLRVIFENGWGLIRASNTTPVLVTRFEATSKEECESYKTHLLALLRNCQKT
ncbi:phosphomannomutase/phosphoglucomutase [Helicobacter sp. MIT 21-1697]|uniref:phosphomannomutase/phosphoglucomutase n=1 Tax=Helicobacter sp. MIT 21-1697 TaxID=2993733 RepID=UPI00224A57DC|nr:phosphomannomutase/phosphoglucomutase [Helicobacter sp. MIT 21-1697]MCX2716250.1 phosphomannomutase/phosphoglucomutase [Helicobacter sp. MIT 21-1697]